MAWMDPSPTSKAIAAVIIFFLGLGSALLPIKVKGNPRLLSLGNAMGAGVLLAAAIVHLFNEAVEHMEGQFEFFEPMAFALCGFGIILTLAVEQIATLITDNAAEKKAASADVNSINGPSNGSLDALSVPALPDTVVAQLTPDARAALEAHYARTLRNSTSGPSLASRTGDANEMGVGLLSADAGPVDVHHHHHGHDHGHSHGPSDEEHGHSHGVPVATESFFSSLVLWFALSFHSVMEGIATGASDSSFTSLFIAVVAHKGLESFALGASMVRSETPMRSTIILCTAFALMTPVGIAIGAIVNSYAAHDSVISAILSSIASGTFLYVGLIEVIMPEFARKQDKIPKLILLFLGFFAMTLIAKWA